MNAQKPITLGQLSHSLKACYRIEDAAWRRFVAMGATEQSSAAQIAARALEVRERVPAWCEQAAWVRIVESFVAWSTAHGNLSVFWALRRKKDNYEQRPQDTEPAG